MVIVNLHCLPTFLPIHDFFFDLLLYLGFLCLFSLEVHTEVKIKNKILLCFIALLTLANILSYLNVTTKQAYNQLI